MKARNESNFYGYVSVLHAVPDAPNVDVYANNNLIAENLAYGKYTDYLRVPAGTYQISVYATGTKTNPVTTTMLSVVRNETFTVIATGMLATIDLLTIRDANVPAVADKALVRFVHISPNAPAVNVTLPGGEVLFEDITYKDVTDYIPLDASVYTLQIRVAATDAVVLTVPRVNAKNNRYYTIYAIGLVGEQPELAALVVQDRTVR